MVVVVFPVSEARELRCRWKMLSYLLLACFVAYATGQVSDGCLSCICQVEGCESQIGKCRPDMGSLSCGPYQIKEPYWIDCGRPGGDWQTCTKQMACSIQCVQAYMRRYATRCTGGRAPTCQDYARVHNGGPNGCKSSGTIGYWRKVQNCCRGKVCGLESEDDLKYEPYEFENIIDEMAQDDK